MFMAAGGRTEPLANPTRGERSSAMRRLVLIGFAAALALAVAAPALAAPTPIEERRVRSDVPLGEADVTLPAGQFCEFELEVADVAGKITSVFITEDRHGNVLERAIFHTTARYTNLDTGEWFERRYDSVVNILNRPDGTVRLIGRNDFFTWYTPEEGSDLGPGAWLIDHGRVVEELDADGNIVSADYQQGDVLDICGALS
jgi:hypothetical protein